jgi:hypothetical protein
MGDLGRSKGPISISEKKVRNLGNGGRGEKNIRTEAVPFPTKPKYEKKIPFSALETI